MMKLELYNYKGDKTLEFNFNNPEIHYNKWIIIKAAKQTLHLNDQNFLLSSSLFKITFPVSISTIGAFFG